ncbi:MAG: hypothetical protein MUO76_03880 [Anaerolineaceae bacterium]|nr:hypothetical protein [Anaerolineaceae bacterium]
MISVKTATIYSGYSMQYLRRLLCLGKLVGLNLGQLWLIEMESFDEYREQAGNSDDHRFGLKIMYNENNKEQ